MELDKEMWGQAIPDLENFRDAYEVILDNSIPLPDEDSIRNGVVDIISRGLVISLPSWVVSFIYTSMVVFSQYVVWPLVIYGYKMGYKKALEDYDIKYKKE